MYRFDSLRAVRIDELKETGYGYLEEILAHLIRSGAKIVELPIIYTERRQGKSKISLREARSTFSALLRCAQILKHQ
jgi:dolichol-phosphate mannosyltransferase